ncbi:MAG: YceI family protein, partial [Candidatus Kapabacteria bacterium]|nr:YceI family protein [Candidatus Kapabacteria bacterium]
RSADFFDSENYPSLLFKSNTIKKLSDNKYLVKGMMTIKDVSKEIELNADYSGLLKDPWGNSKAGFLLETTINRKDFGLTWNAALETGGVLVSEDVRIICEIQLQKQ